LPYHLLTFSNAMMGDGMEWFLSADGFC
jgi:hypothetical protein